MLASRKIIRIFNRLQSTVSSVWKWSLYHHGATPCLQLRSYCCPQGFEVHVDFFLKGPDGRSQSLYSAIYDADNCIPIHCRNNGLGWDFRYGIDTYAMMCTSQQRNALEFLNSNSVYDININSYSYSQLCCINASPEPAGRCYSTYACSSHVTSCSHNRFPLFHFPANPQLSYI